MAHEIRCGKCGYTKQNLVHPENWGDHQKQVMAYRPEAAQMMNHLPHAYEPIPEAERCGECDGTGFYEFSTDGSGMDCRHCNKTGRQP